MSKKNDKGRSIFGLGKVPDSAIIKQQGVEIGILKSTIDELEYKLKQAENEAKSKSPENLENLQKDIQKLNNKVESLSNQLNKKNKDYDQLEDRFRTLSRKNVLMEKELFRTLKEKHKK
jgi:peptidoglycan hydrolase CwlO-like protein